MKKIVPQSVKNVYHLLQAILANVIYGFPARIATPARNDVATSGERSVAGGSAKKIKVIGVTGTNGKTTTCQMISRILEEAGYKVALSSTINFKIGEKEWVNKTKYTTLSSFSVQKFIKQAVEAQCQYLVLEVSSHSLDQNRLWGINFDVAVITNVTREHLDYHKNMEEYRKAKLKLFRNAKTAVVNLDMEKPKSFINCKEEEIYGYTTRKQESVISDQKIKLIKAEKIKLGTQGTIYEVQDTRYEIQLIGLFNIENALAATCVGISQEINPEVIKTALEKIKGVPGRMERVPNDKGIEIIVDYAVTPDSLEKLYKLISQIKCHSRESGNPENLKWIPGQTRNDKESKIIAVFGACGERDRGKRPIMGGIVARYADYIIVTNEDPYGEDSVQIINEVFSGVIGSPCSNPHPDFASAQSFLSRKRERKLEGEGKMMENVNCWRILDRREAIKKALRMAKPGDYVIVTGKGAEETMAVGKKRIPWKDKEVILDELGNM